MISRTVSLSFPVPKEQNKVSLSVDDTEVKEALKLIDNVLTSDGFIRDQNPDNSTVQGFVASYSKMNEEGLRRIDELPGVYIRDNRLEVVFTAGRNPSGYLSVSAKKLLDSLRTKLSDRFGSQSVRVVKTN